MAKAVQRRRGTTAEHASFTGLAGEITVDTDKKVVVVHDGATAGGIPLAKYSDIAALLASGDVMSFEGVIDCSANPNYPAADAGAVYKISVAGKIGGGSGVNVQAGDTLYCITDSSASGNHATVGANWVVVQLNLEAASETVAGFVELATDAETQTGSDTARAITPANLTASAIKQGKHTIWIPASAMVPRTTNGAAPGTAEMSSNKNMVKTLDFDASTQEFAQFEIAMPKSWNEGTVTFQPVWSHPSTTTNFGVVWALQGVATSDDDALDVAFGTEQTSTDTGGTTNDRYIGPESSAITIGGTPAEGDVVQFQVKRVPADGSDTMAVDARLHGIKLYITNNAATDA